MPKKKILFIIGSVNQATQAHAVGKMLDHSYDCYYTHFYADGLLRWAAEHGLLDNTVLGTTGRFRQKTAAYAKKHNLPMDDRGEGHDYDLIVTTSDLVIPRNIRNKKLILLQEGMTDPENFAYHLVTNLPIPKYLASTSANGLSNQYDIFCVASEGYKTDFIRKGAHPDKLVVTGMPNYDDAAQHYQNNFPYRNYVLVATSDARETWKWDNRKKFIRKAVKIADGRPLIFKLHPNEKERRATREILEEAPQALVLRDGNIDEMIANCDVLITQYSTVVYTGIALEKKVYSYFDVEKLKELAPWQNGGTSNQRIAQVCQAVIEEGPAVARERFNYAIA